MKPFREFNLDTASFSLKSNYHFLLDEAIKPKNVKVVQSGTQLGSKYTHFTISGGEYVLAVEQSTGAIAFYTFGDDDKTTDIPPLTRTMMLDAYRGIMTVLPGLVVGLKKIKFTSDHERLSKMYSVMVKNKSFLDFFKGLGFVGYQVEDGWHTFTRNEENTT